MEVRLSERGSAWGVVRAASYGVVLLAAQSFPYSMVLAGDWRTTVSVGVREEFTDNVDLATEGQNRHSDLISTVTPSISVRGAGGRVSGNLDYSLDKSFYKNDSNRNDTNNNLTANGRAEIWNRVFFIDGQASISQQRADNSRPTSSSQAGQRINRTDVRSLNLSPYFLHHFGTWVETESRLTLSKVTSDSGAADTSTNRQTFTADSGRRFSRLLWTGTIDSQKTDRDDGSPKNESFRSNADFTYVVDPKISLLFGGGFERIEDDTLTDEPSGLIWNVGVDLRPGRRTSLRATFGDRFDSDVFTLDARHQLSSRTTISASFDETIQTSQQAVAQNTGFIGTDVTGNLVDTRTGLPFVAGSNNFGFSTAAFRQKRFDARITGTRRRNRFNAGIYWESRETDSTGIEEIVLGGNLGFSRRLTQKMDADLGVSYSDTDFGTVDNRSAEDFSFSAGLNYRIFRNIQGTLNYILTHRKDDVGGNGLTENSVAIGLRKTF